MRNIFVLTLGLVETWRTDDGWFLAAFPPRSQLARVSARFHMLTVAEIGEDLEAIGSLIAEDWRAVLSSTVSPIPRNASFTGTRSPVWSPGSWMRSGIAVSPCRPAVTPIHPHLPDGADRCSGRSMGPRTPGHLRRRRAHGEPDCMDRARGFQAVSWTGTPRAPEGRSKGTGSIDGLAPEVVSISSLEHQDEIYRGPSRAQRQKGVAVVRLHE